MKFQLEEAIEILAATPSTLGALLVNLPERWTEGRGDRDNWTPFDIVGHYIHAEEADWIPRARAILNGNGEFQPFDRYAQFDGSKHRSLRQLVATFAERRAGSLETLKSWNLTREDLGKKGVHPELGEVTLEQLLSTWVVHDLTHIRQIVTNLAKNYTENVGPWKEHLSVLK